MEGIHARAHESGSKYFLAPDRLAKLDAKILRRGTFYIFLLLLFPNPIGDWVYYLAGLSTIPLPVFLLLWGVSFFVRTEIHEGRTGYGNR